MIDIDTFRSELHAAPDEPLGVLDIDRVLVRGRRMRTRRRLAVSGGATVLAAAVVAVPVGAGWLSHGSAAPGAAQLPAAPAVSASAASPSPSGPAVLGDVVATGLRKPGGEVVLYAVPIDEPSLPDIHFGVMAGLRDAAGGLTGVVEANEVTGSDRASGFHAVQAPTQVNGVTMPQFGYYVGRAAKITGTVSGRTVRAKTAAWSENPNVVLFWFDPADTGGKEPSRLKAYDAAGRQLPTGDATVGHG